MRGRAGEVVGEPSDDAAFLFDQTQIRTYDLTISSSDLARIDRRPSAEEVVPATLRFLGRSYRVGVRYKGSIGSFLAPCTAQAFVAPSTGPKTGKCSIKIEFDEYDDDQRFYGLKKLNLHAMGRDPSMMKERLGYMLFREMQVAAPRAMHARVVINGRLEGLFLAVEQIDGRFTKSRFVEGGDGNLYKEIWPSYDDDDTYRDALETNEGDDTDVSKMLAFKRAIDQGPSSVLRWVDRDYVLRYLAVDRLIINDDGMMHWYCSRIGAHPTGPANHNFFWYEAENIDLMWLIPWDLDGSFGDGRGSVAVTTQWYETPSSCSCRSQRAPSCDPLTRVFASWLEDYDLIVDAFIRGPFSQEAIDAKLNTWSAQIAPYVQESAGIQQAPSTSAWRQKLDELRQIIASSRRYRGQRY